MNDKQMAQMADDIRMNRYNQLKQQQYALNMQIRLAMQAYDTDMKASLEKELEEINRQIMSK